MATEIRVEGLEALQRALADNPAAAKRTQRLAVKGAAKTVRRNLQRKLRAGAGARSGELKRSISVYVPRGQRAGLLHISGSRAMVPHNAETGYMTRELNKLQGQIGEAVNDEIIKWIRRAHGGN